MVQTKFREVRERKGLRREDVAAQLKVSIASLSNWETGKVSPNAKNVLKMCDLYGCTSDELLGRR